MSGHIHTDVVHIIVYGASAILFINIWRLASAWIATKAPGIGNAMGALTQWGNS